MRVSFRASVMLVMALLTVPMFPKASGIKASGSTVKIYNDSSLPVYVAIVPTSKSYEMGKGISDKHQQLYGGDEVVSFLAQQDRTKLARLEKGKLVQLSSLDSSSRYDRTVWVATAASDLVNALQNRYLTPARGLFIEVGGTKPFVKVTMSSGKLKLTTSYSVPSEFKDRLPVAYASQKKASDVQK